MNCTAPYDARCPQCVPCEHTGRDTYTLAIEAQRVAAPSVQMADIGALIVLFGMCILKQLLGG